MDKKEQIKPLGEVYSIEVSKIAPNPNQPRKIFTDDAILKLADSIRQFGIMQPLTVRKVNDSYELISGERRLRAAKELGMAFVPCLVSSVSDQASAEMAIIENLMREDLNIFEQAEAIEVLIDTYSMTQEGIAKKLSVSQSFIANKLRLLRLSKDEREKIIANNLTERHARALLKIYAPDLREKVLGTIISQGLNVAKAEELIEKAISGSDEEKPKKRAYKTIDSFYESLSRAISMASNSGIKIKSRKIENDSYTELTILIPKEEEAPEQELLVTI